MIEVNGGQRSEDHFVEITEMIQARTMPENLPSAESIRKLESKRREKPKALRHWPNETDITGDSNR